MIRNYLISQEKVGYVTYSSFQNLGEGMGFWTEKGDVEDLPLNAEEVENHILAHPKVEDCAYVAMPDRVLGEKGPAFVLPKPGQTITTDELNTFLRQQRNIATFKLPERLEIVDQFPMTNIGKINKEGVRRIVAEKLEQEEDKGR